MIQQFGPYGGRYVPETLVPACEELAKRWQEASADPSFHADLERLFAEYSGRPTPLTECHRLTAEAGGARIVLKREDLNHTGAHKINNALGQALLARRMGKRRLIAETGAGQHGVATATVAALFGFECEIYMGRRDMERQALNVARMRLLGARVQPVASGSKTLKDATNEAIRDWVTNVETTHYVIGSVVGPDPYPRLVRELQSVIGRESRRQCLDRYGRLPDAVVAAVGGGSNAIGIFHAFRDDLEVRLIGVEAAGRGLDTPAHAASLTRGTPGVLHGSYSYVLMDGDGQVREAHSISAGLDYPGVGPEHAHLRDTGRATYLTATDDEALTAFRRLAEAEGIIPALESAHALSRALELAAALPADGLVLVCLSGRGDKDVDQVARRLGLLNPPRETVPTGVFA